MDDVLPLGQSGFGDEFLSPALGELIGAAVGDGCISRQPDQDFLTVSLSGEEAGVANRLQANIVESKRFLELDDGRAFRSTRVVRTSSGLRVGSSVARLLECMQCYAVLDRGSENKLFTDEIFSLDRATQAAVLRGLFTTDGTVANYGEKSQYVSLDSTSLELLQQVQLMLLGFGIKGKLYENRRALGQDHALLPDGKGGSRLYPVRQMHSLRISRHSRVLFEREIGFLAESHKARKLSELNRNVTAYREEAGGPRGLPDALRKPRRFRPDRAADASFRRGRPGGPQLLGIHVHQRLGVQPGEPEPAEVPPGGRQLRHPAVPLGGPRLRHRAGDPGRSRQLPQRANLPQQPRIPPAGAWLRESGLADHVAGPAVRFGRRTGDGGGADGDHDRRRVRHQRGAVLAAGTVRRVPSQPPVDAGGHSPAPRARGQDFRRPVPAGTGRGGGGGMGPGDRGRRAERLSQRAGHGAGADGHDRLHDGLRHHGHRAGHRAGQVQAACRGRHVQDRQPHGAAGPGAAEVQQTAGRRDHRPHRPERHDRRRPAPGGGAPGGFRLRSSSPPRAIVRSTTWATSG